MAKKKKRDPAQMHRQVQDSLQALPYIIDKHKQEGKWFKAFVLRYMSSPMLRLMNRMLGASRYRGTEGQKLRQTEKMRRHLEQKQAAIKHVQKSVQQTQKNQKKKKAQ